MLPGLVQFVRKHRLVSAGDRVGVAVSGGADSVALLRALIDLKASLGIVLSVVHLHHGLRGTDADDDAAFVERLAAENHLPLHIRRVDVAALAAEKKLSIEAAGRRARLDYFAELRAQGVLDKVATAHTADDQAETVLLKFLRGAGTRGLAAIYPVSESNGLIRPLLANTRFQIETYLGELKQKWHEDATNRSPEFLRNRVRHELLPIIERDYNPAIREALANSAEIAREEQNFWDSTIAHLLVDLRSENGLIDAGAFRAMHIALQRRVLMALARDPFDFDHIEAAREFIAEGKAGEREIARGLRIHYQRDSSGKQWFSWKTNFPEGANYSLELHLPGAIQLPAPRNTRLVARHASHPAFGAALCMSLAGKSLTVRNWRAGDRYQPTGRGEAKLKDLFQQMHVPASARSTWPVAELDGQIVWVLGLPVAAPFASQESEGFILEEVTSQEAQPSGK